MVIIGENNKKECCGCTACKNVCPKDAISMEEDIEGFLYPVIDKNKCIKCGLCDKVCPIKNKKENNHNKIIPFIVRTKNEKQLMESTSGGFFTPIAKYIIEQKNGNVFGVIYDSNDKKIKHICINNKNYEKIELLKGSKYVQSHLGDIFKSIRKLLEDGEVVLFSGTPCQVEGLIKFLRKDYSNLITVDLICHGVPSPKLWKEYVKYQENKYKSEIESVNFRNKTYGYHSGTMKLVFKNKKKYYGSARVDFLLKSFFSEIASRPACYDCQFKNRNHLADFTIFDCWYAKDINNIIDEDDNGFTNLFINSEKGKILFDDVKDNYYVYRNNIERTIELNGVMVEKSKHILYKTGMLQVIKKVRSKIKK